jgi:hypothetical protein
VKRHVLVVGHADADGHIIAEQVRRNLETIPTFDVSVVVDPRRTTGHKMWTRLDEIVEIEDNELIFFVDLMFAPASFGVEADALVDFAKARPTKQFFVLDHHPLPLRRLSAPNIKATYRQDVMDCTVGASSPMMIVAALCEKQATRARDVDDPVYELRATGILRAAALGGPLPGKKLSALLRANHWKDFEELGREDRAEHPRPRGYRPHDAPPSKMLERLDRIATELLTSTSPHPRRSLMSHDFDADAVMDRKPPTVTAYVPLPKDLESIVALLEVSALYLTHEPGATFTFDQLLDQARVIGGDSIVIDKSDAEIVLDKASFLTGGKAKLRLK